MTVPAIPQGFRVAGAPCGIKQGSSKEDVSLFVTDRDAVVAGVYTQNLVFAAPVAVDRSRTPSSNARVVVVNSGNANACTGDRGHEDALAMCRLAAEACGAAPEQALVMSTGVIGVFLPMERVAAGIAAAAKRLGTDDDSLLAAARGILTTDNGTKLAGRAMSLPGCECRITGVCKGAAMIGPRMATMLCLLLTDAALHPEDAQRLLSDAVNDSFNCIAVEGHMSTNDTVLLMANGAASHEPLAGSALAKFQEQLREVCIELARQIPNDGEGSTHLITIDVQGCRNREEARLIAKTVAESALVKTAITGADPNWGRIVSAAGYSGVAFDPRGVELQVNGCRLFQAGCPVPFDAAEVSQSIRQQRETFIQLTFREGAAGVRFWTSDLTAEYVRLNSEYTT